MWVSRLSRHRTSTACTVEAGIPSRSRDLRPGPAAASSAGARSCGPPAPGSGSGCRCGARGPVDHAGRAHLRGSGRPTASRSARTRRSARRPGRPASRWSTISRASRRRARGVRAALAWDTKTSWVVERFLDSSTPHREVFTHHDHQIVSSHDLDQRAWSVHLGLGLVQPDGDVAARRPARSRRGSGPLRRPASARTCRARAPERSGSRRRSASARLAVAGASLLPPQPASSSPTATATAAPPRVRTAAHYRRSVLVIGPCTLPTRSTGPSCSAHSPAEASAVDHPSAWPLGSGRPGPARWLMRCRALPGPRV